MRLESREQRRTERRAKVAGFIASYTEARGDPPSYATIGDYFGVSAKTIRKDLEALRKAGAVTWTRGKRGTLRAIK